MTDLHRWTAIYRRRKLLSVTVSHILRCPAASALAGDSVEFAHANQAGLSECKDARNLQRSPHPMQVRLV